MSSGLDPEQLRALAAAVSEGTFDAAAQVLHITPSAVSQRIRALETRSGRVLVQRTKPIAPTESGRVLLRAARQLQAVADDVARELGQGLDSPQMIALAVNADSLATWFLPALMHTGDAVAFELRRDDETRTAALLRDGSVMAAVTATREPVPGCMVRRLGAMRYRACAAPAFAARWFSDSEGAPSPDALARAPVVTFDRGDKLQDRWLRRRTRRALTPPRHYVPGSGAFVEAIALGLGWGLVPDLQAEPLRSQDRLVGLDDAHPVDVALYWQQWGVPSATLEQVAEAIRVQATQTLR